MPEPPATEAIEIAVDAQVATVTLNRPEHLNAFSEDMAAEVARTWEWIRDEDDVHAVVLRANGERAF